MKRAFLAISLIALVTVGIAGPFAMLGMNDHSSCPVAAAAKLPCAVMGTVSEHIALLQQMLTAVPAALVLVLLAALGIWSFTGGLLDMLAPPHRPVFFAALVTDTAESRRASARWQARLAHSPTTA